MNADDVRRIVDAYNASNGVMRSDPSDKCAHVMREGYAHAFLRAWDLMVEGWHGPHAYYSVENPDPDADERMLPYFEHPDIRVLKMVVDVINGGAGSALYLNTPSMFSPSIEGYIEQYRVPPYRDLLQLRDRDMQRFIIALEESRSSRGPDDPGPWEDVAIPPF